MACACYETVVSVLILRRTSCFKNKYHVDSKKYVCSSNKFIILYHISHLVLGALIGKQKGRNIEVMNSFELIIDTIDGDIIIDKEYYTTKEEQCKY